MSWSRVWALSVSDLIPMERAEQRNRGRLGADLVGSMRLANPVLSRSPLPSAWASRPTLWALAFPPHGPAASRPTPRAHALVFSAPVCMGQPASSAVKLYTQNTRITR